MPHYDKIIAILCLWKSNIQLPNEHRMFSIEPHSTITFGYNIFAIMSVDNADDKSKCIKEKSDVLTLAGLGKDIPDLEAKMKTLVEFLETFTNNFYKKVEKELK